MIGIADHRIEDGDGAPVLAVGQAGDGAVAHLLNGVRQVVVESGRGTGMNEG